MNLSFEEISDLYWSNSLLRNSRPATIDPHTTLSDSVSAVYINQQTNQNAINIQSVIQRI